ncbi:P-loop containing nucleoside triphosphate hydrolase protein [Mycena sp. CBHHK59/15]|nr:P-loop containing nucleoside triphosphate hydrolase protein [Mycena sp. CBHHK59/15]
MWGTFEEVTTGLGDEDPLAKAVEKPASPEDRPYAAEVDKNLKDVFRLESFRPDQFEAICATMDGRDVFVLMPTGGGKSLCYQLPAICVQGQTRGVTIVVSPLLALMRDQVSALRALGVDAVSLDSETPVEEAKEIWKRISSGVPPMLLYVTPERLIRNPSFRDIISKLYRAKQLARFVIDEAHCISTWIEFRATYGDLHELRDNFPGVPIMALTATATPETVDNIVESLKLENPAIFRQSFNRTNLNYRVVTKVNVDEMVGFIKKYHPNKSGIIFTMTKSACKKLSSQLAKKGLSARHFHAKISPKDKEDVLSQWHSGECRIVVATTAFGMGINKADVRFVIHFGLPKTLDGYYQETGRAGRDGLAADCVLYYSDQDLKKMVKITSDDTSQKQALRVVEEYCKNDSVCRRTQLLQHLGETFDEKDCHSLCDNCTNDSEALDFTKEAKSVVELVQFFENQHMRVTLLHCLAVYRGNDTKEIRENGRNKNPAYGSGSSVAKEVARLIFTKLLGLKILREEASQFSNYTAYYLKLGPDAANFLEGNVRIVLQVNSRKSKPTAKTRFKGPLRNDAIPSSFFDSLKTRHSREEDESDEDEIRLNGGPKDSQMTEAVAPGSAQSPHSVEEIEVDSDSDELLLKGPHKSERKNSVDLDRLYKKLLAHRQQVSLRTPALIAHLLTPRFKFRSSLIPIIL